MSDIGNPGAAGAVPPKRRTGQVFLWAAFLLVAGFFGSALFRPMCACSTREKAYVASMKSDLKNLMTQQEIYFYDADSYTTVEADLAFASSDGVIVAIGASGTGWTANTRHKSLPDDVGCAILYGDIDWTMRTPGGQAPTEPGVIVCDPADR